MSERGSRQQKKLFQALFAELPAKPNHCLEALAEINHRFRLALAEQLTPIVRTLLQEEPPESDDGRKQLARCLNRVLHDANLAIVNEEGDPAFVMASPFRLRLQSRKPGRTHTYSKNTLSLPPLELMEHFRREPLQKWWQDQVRNDDPPSAKTR